MKSIAYIEGREKSFILVAATMLSVVLILGGCSSSSQPDQAADMPVESQETAEVAIGEEPAAEPKAIEIPVEVEVKEGIEEYSWAELKGIANMMAATGDKAAAQDIAAQYNLCEAGGGLTEMGAKPITLSDGTSAAVRLVGIMHDKTDSGEPIAMTLMFDSALAEQPFEANGDITRGWSDSSLRSWLASDGLALMPDDLQQLIAPASKESYGGPTVDTLWCPALVELVGQYSDNAIERIAEGERVWIATFEDFNEEGEQYDFFTQSGCDTSDLGAKKPLIKIYDGQSCGWWQRTVPHFINEEKALAVSDEGTGFSSANVDTHQGVVPFFCL